MFSYNLHIIDLDQTVYVDKGVVKDGSTHKSKVAFCYMFLASSELGKKMGYHTP